MNGNCEQEPLQNTTKHEFENITCYEPTKLYDSIEANIRTPIFLFFQMVIPQARYDQHSNKTSTKHMTTILYTLSLSLQ